jgi:hypothetical protein
MVSAHLLVGVDEKQNLLEIISPIERLTYISGILEIEVEKLQVDGAQSRVKGVQQAVGSGLLVHHCCSSFISTGH